MKAIDSGVSDSASRYMAVRHDQKSSESLGTGALRVPRNARWKAWECAVASAGSSR